MEPQNSPQDQVQPEEQQNALVPKCIEIYRKVQAEMGDSATSEAIRLVATNEFFAWYHQEVKGPFLDEELMTVMNAVIASETMNILNKM